MKSICKDVAIFLVVSCFIVGISASSGRLWFNVPESTAIFADISYSAKFKSFTAATWLNPPFMVSSYDPKNSTAAWTVSGQNVTNMRVQSASHKYDAGKPTHTSENGIELLIGEYQDFTNIFVLSGFTMSGQEMWSVKHNNVSVDLIDAGPFSISDDSTLGAYHYYDWAANTTVFIILNAQTGEQYWNWTTAGFCGASDMQFAKDSSLIAFDAYGFLMVFQATTGVPHGAPYQLPLKVDSNPHNFVFFKNGNLEYIACGAYDLQVAKYDATSNSYQQLWDDYSHVKWFLAALDVATVGNQVYLVAGWFSDSFRQVLVELRQIETMSPEWAYNTTASTGKFQDQISDIVIDPSGWIAVSTWGDQSLTTPQVMLFSYDTPLYLFAAGTPGSMFSVDLYFDGSSVWLAAAGKHIHANMLGYGGDLFSWQFTP